MTNVSLVASEREVLGKPLLDEAAGELPCRDKINVKSRGRKRLECIRDLLQRSFHERVLPCGIPGVGVAENDEFSGAAG